MLTPNPTEPHKARLTKDNVIIKDRYYYQGNEFSWNNPAKITDKYYPYYHQQKEENKNKIEELKNQEKQDKDVLEEIRREQILEKKHETQARYAQRALENALIQAKSQQPSRSLQNLDSSKDLEEEALDVIAKRIDASKHLRTNEISWNHLQKASKKFIDQVIRPICIEREKEMIEGFKKKVDNERKIEEDKLTKRSERHKALRETFLEKHEENFDREKKLGLAPISNSFTTKSLNNITSSNEKYPSIHIMDGDHSTNGSSRVLPVIGSGPSLMSVDGEFKLKFISSLPNLDEQRPESLRSLEKLAIPRRVKENDYSLDHSELKGTLITNMDYKVYHSGNEFYKALASQNQFFADTLKENREARKRISQGIKLKSLNDILIENKTKASLNKAKLGEQKEVFDEISNFEKKIGHQRSSGYTKADWEATVGNMEGKYFKH